MVQPQSTKVNPIVIKKYANRRLYNTDTSAYVTLDDLCQMIKRGEEIIVFDAKNGDDITRSVLTQIIVEQEAKDGQNLLPTNFLRQLISMYGNNLQGVVPKYLEHTMQVFSKNQHQLQDYFRNALGGQNFGQNFGNMFSMSTLEEMGKQNMAMFEQAMKLFAPFAMPGAPAGTGTQENAAAKPAAAKAESARADDENEGPRLRPVSTPSDESDEGDEVEQGAEGSDEEGDSSVRDMQKRLNDLQKQIANMQKE